MEAGIRPFDTGARLVECASCGGTLEAPLEGSRTTCRRCGTVTDIPARHDVPMRAALEDPAQEQARLASLSAQRSSPAPLELYDLETPPPGFTADPSRDAGSADALRSAWNAARPTLWQVSPAKQRDALWLALHLADVHVAGGEAERARALLETALDLLADGGLRHLIRCRLATLALWQSDAPSAYQWLLGCDFAAEELPLDSALRENQAALSELADDHLLTLALVGDASLAVPIAPGWERPCGVRRVRALSALGRDDEADTELARLLATPLGIGIEAEIGAAHPVVTRRSRRLLEEAAKARDAIPAGRAAIFGELGKLPYLTLGVLLLVAMPRWFFDADPTGGVEGYLLCPHVCADCRGPFRVHTPWRHEGGSHSTNGADYYCQSASVDVSQLAESEITRVRPALRPLRVTFAASALTYLLLLLLLLPVSAGVGLREHYLAKARRREHAPGIEALAAAAGLPVPAEKDAPAAQSLRAAGWTIAKAVGIATMVVVGEIVVRKVLG